MCLPFHEGEPRRLTEGDSARRERRVRAHHISHGGQGERAERRREHKHSKDDANAKRAKATVRQEKSKIGEQRTARAKLEEEEQFRAPEQLRTRQGLCIFDEGRKKHARVFPLARSCETSTLVTTQ